MDRALVVFAMIGFLWAGLLGLLARGAIEAQRTNEFRQACSQAGGRAVSDTGGDAFCIKYETIEVRYL